MADTNATRSPTLDEERRRLQKWRAVRENASAKQTVDSDKRAESDRQARLDQFEAEKNQRIREAEQRRRDEAAAIETRRMEKARVHLEALEDIEAAQSNLAAKERQTRKITTLMFGLFVGFPTILTAFHFLLAPPVFSSVSIIALENAVPDHVENPMFNELSARNQGNMASAFQLRTLLKSKVVSDFEMEINTSQGLITITTTGRSAEIAQTNNLNIVKEANHLSFPDNLNVLKQPNRSAKPVPRVISNTLITLFVSTSVFAISGLFVQSFRHYART